MSKDLFAVRSDATRSCRRLRRWRRTSSALTRVGKSRTRASLTSTTCCREASSSRDGGGAFTLKRTNQDNKDPRVGDPLRVRARGALPYELNFVIEAVDLVPSKKVAVRTVSDFEGLWTATLSQRGKDVHVDLVWQVTVLRPILKFLAPVLRPPSPGTIAGRRCAGRRVEGVSCGEKAVTSASLPISRSVMRMPLPPLCVSQRARRCRRPPGGRR